MENSFEYRKAVSCIIYEDRSDQAYYAQTDQAFNGVLRDALRFLLSTLLECYSEFHS